LQFDGRNRALLRAALRFAGLTEISIRTDKGFHNEQLIEGLANRERKRLQAGLTGVETFAPIDGEALRVRVDDWLASPDYRARDIHEVATLGIWLSQLHGQTAMRIEDDRLVRAGGRG
jgi:hypothetical protein